jgi:hypothetical protein
MKKIKYFISFILISLLVLLLVQCREKINIKLGNNLPRLVVDGMITNDSIVHTIQLSTTNDYYATQVSPVVTQANVTINNETSTITLIEKPVNSGIYVTPVNYTGIPGKKYTLNIKLKTAINGQTDYTASEVMPNTCHPDSIKLVHHAGMDISGFWETALYIQDLPEDNFYSFRGYRNGTLITQKLSQVETSDDKLFNGMYMKGLSALVWDPKYPSQNIQALDKITLQVGSVTKEYFAFINEIKLEVEHKNPLFSGPSSNVSTNISNGGSGYFAVCAISYVSTIYRN